MWTPCASVFSLRWLHVQTMEGKVPGVDGGRESDGVSRCRLGTGPGGGAAE